MNNVNDLTVLKKSSILGSDSECISNNVNFSGKGHYAGPVGRLLETDVWKLSYKKKWKRIPINFPKFPDEVGILS
jgi:hypothetical protein